jgi:hypothetical protein
MKMNFTTLAADLDEKDAYLYEANMQLDVLTSEIFDNLSGEADRYVRGKLLLTIYGIKFALNKALE